ncbi:uncharacterized protein LOC124196498 [Daphnia pulex]|uniref:uncharacterized protein LOC124196498 n=1 Tax=Daphnia pulex TaxID=6669 RepID=UPI001EDDC69F|nr:uncharacterized protein LOC124196498 [Daphnia pulex]
MTKETKSKSNHVEGSSTSTSSRKIRNCYDCEIFFQPKSNTEKCCSDCSKGVRPYANHKVDHIYLENVQNSSEEVLSKSFVGFKQDQPPLNKQLNICNKETERIDRLNPAKIRKLENGNVSSNSKKNELPVSHYANKTAATNILSVSSNTNIEKQVHQKPTSKISPIKRRDIDVSQQRQQLVKWNPSRVVNSLDDPAVSPIIDFKLVPSPWNPKSDCTHVELLDGLRAEERELEKLITSYSLEFNEVLSEQKRLKITELETKLLIEKELLASKEDLLKSLERQASQTQCLVDACKEERDSLSNIAKEFVIALSLARSQAVAAEKGVSEAKQKLNSAKEGDFKNYLRNTLAMKEKRAEAAVKGCDLAVSQLENAKKDLQDAEEDLETKNAAYQQTLEQIEKEKSELMVVRYNRASVDLELNLYYSQLKSRTENNENYRNLLELKKKMLGIKFQIEKEELLRNLEIKYNRMREELNLGKDFTNQFL